MLQTPVSYVPLDQSEQPAAAKRRTFAIISHPDAGETTPTEKLLLFGGAIQMAGHVKARGERRRTRSDCLEIERARGISVGSSVMTFEHGGITFNLPDTPGHADFSEDARLEPAPYETARWIAGADANVQRFVEAHRSSLAEDKNSALVFLAKNGWTLNRAIEEWPDVKFLQTRERQ